MFKKLKKIEGVNGIEFVKDRFYTFLNSEKRLYEFSINGKSIWHSDELDIYYRYHITDKQVLYTMKDKELGTFILDRKTKQLLKHEQSYLNINNQSCYDNNTLYSFSEGNIVVYDLSLFSFRSLIPDNTLGVVCYILDDKIITKDLTSIYITKPISPFYGKKLFEDCRIPRNRWRACYRGDQGNV